MNPIFKKLNYKDQKVIHVFSPPEPFLHHMEDMKHLVSFRSVLYPDEKASFVLAFVTKQNEINELVPTIANALEGDGVLWLAYPKGTSKNYKCDFNRDTGWEILENTVLKAYDKWRLMKTGRRCASDVPNISKR